MPGSTLSCSTSGRPACPAAHTPRLPAAPLQQQRQHAQQRRCRLRVAQPQTEGAAPAAVEGDDHQIDTSDAFAELVRMAVAKDPSLAPLAEQHLKKKASEVGAPASPFAPIGGAPHAGGARASAMLGPGLASLPNSSKPAWLRQRAPQGDKYKELFGQMRGLGLATVCEEAQCPNIGECWNGDMGAWRCAAVQDGVCGCNCAVAFAGCGMGLL